MNDFKNFQQRLDILRRKLSQKNLSAFLISNPVNIFYFCGFKGFLSQERESFLIVNKTKSILYLPKIYETQIHKFKGLKIKIVVEWSKVFEEILKNLKKYKGKIGFEAEDLKFTEYSLFKKRISFLPLEDFVIELRKIKNDEEISKIKKASKITDIIFRKILKSIKGGVSEKQISNKIRQLAENFSEGVAFQPIVAFGKQTSIPHYLPSDKKLKTGQPILIDFGVKFEGYCSDFTRMIYFGRASGLFKKRYKIVRETQEKAFRIIKPGLKTKELYKIIKDNLGNEAKYFFHAAGHGIGLEPHEKPHLKISSKEELKEREVLAIEPGIYYKNEYGIRIEDCGWVTKKGFKIFSKIKRDLIEI